MSAAFELESFERLVALPGTVLLRVAGRWRAGDDRELPVPVLRSGDRLLTALPAPAPPRAGPDAPRWAGAYVAPAEGLGGAFALELGGELVPLPSPADGGAVPSSVAPVDVRGLQERAAEVAHMAREALREAGPLRERAERLERELGDREEELDDLRRRCHDAEAAQAEEAAARRRAEEEADGLARRLEEAELARDNLRAAAREAERAAREARGQALREVPPPEDEDGGAENLGAVADDDAGRPTAPEPDPARRERTLVTVLFLVALLAGCALVALELTHVLDVTGSF